jgi:membrane fusion protein, copper/silver efflux system
LNQVTGKVSGMRKGTLALVILTTFSVAFLTGTWVAHKSSSKGVSEGKKILYYVDPMHPAYKSDKPGIAPDCGMQLEPVYADGSTSGEGAPAGPPGTATIPLAKQQAIGMEVGRAELVPWSGTLRLLGRVVPDEGRTYSVNAASDIWVRKAFPPTTGSVVKKDEPLAAYYTGGFLAAANAYMYALDTKKRHSQTADISQAQAQNLDFQMRQAVGNLINMGVSESQIKEMGDSGNVSEFAEIRSPSNGFILSRSVSAGQFIPTGGELYRIADLSRVWILAETYESEGSLLSPGMVVKATHPQTKHTFHATVTQILPQFDPQTRTMKVRLEADNRSYALRPDMFVDLEIAVRYPPAITVPSEAVVDTGLRKTVFVDRGNGSFEPRRVETGRRFGERIEITRGIMNGETIVVSGTFLVDSESRMKMAAAGIYGESAKDPVCDMDIDIDKATAAGRMIQYKGTTYYFCSDTCKNKFQAAPGSFVKMTGGLPAGKMEMTDTREENKEREKESRDPVCGMDVDTAEAKAAGRVSQYKGKSYYFCADSCKRDFDGNPEKYVMNKP